MEVGTAPMGFRILLTFEYITVLCNCYALILVASAINCEWVYGEFGPCSVSCGEGTRERLPVILQPSQFGGQDCPPFVLDGVSDILPCDTGSCPGKETYFVGGKPTYPFM